MAQKKCFVAIATFKQDKAHSENQGPVVKPNTTLNIISPRFTIEIKEIKIG